MRFGAQFAALVAPTSRLWCVEMMRVNGRPLTLRLSFRNRLYVTTQRATDEQLVSTGLADFVWSEATSHQPRQVGQGAHPVVPVDDLVGWFDRGTHDGAELRLDGHAVAGIRCRVRDLVTVGAALGDGRCVAVTAPHTVVADVEVVMV